MSVDRDAHLHLWMDEAADLVLADLIELDVRLLAGLLRDAGLGGAAWVLDENVVRHIVLIDEANRLAGLDGDCLLAELLVLLHDGESGARDGCDQQGRGNESNGAGAS